MCFKRCFGSKPIFITERCENIVDSENAYPLLLKQARGPRPYETLKACVGFHYVVGGIGVFLSVRGFRGLGGSGEVVFNPTYKKLLVVR